jgi:hypothetical protein
VLSVGLWWSETEMLMGSAAAPPSIKGLGAFLRSVEEKTLPPWPAVVAGELAVVGDAMRFVYSGRP